MGEGGGGEEAERGRAGLGALSLLGRAAERGRGSGWRGGGGGGGLREAALQSESGAAPRPAPQRHGAAEREAESRERGGPGEGGGRRGRGGGWGERCGAVGPAVLLGDSRRNGGGLGGTAEEGDEPSGLREGAACKRVLPYGFQRGIAARPGMGGTPEERRAPHGSAPRPLPSVCSSIPHSPLMSAAVRAHGGTSPSGWRIPRAVRCFPCLQHSDPSPYPCPGAARRGPVAQRGPPIAHGHPTGRWDSG